MPSFILRNLNPEFWAQVQAKAAREGTTVKALILRLLTRWLAAAALLFVVGCTYHPPTAPDVPVVDERAPAVINLATQLGTGAEAGHATVTATVQNVHGAPVAGVSVTFASPTAAIGSTSVETDDKGHASTTVTAAPSEPTKVTATAGQVTAQTMLVTQPAPPPPLDPGPPAPPAPGPPGPGPLTVKLLVTPGATGTETTFGLASEGITRAVWTFGDGASLTTTVPRASHVYTAAGTYTASVTITDTIGRTASNSQTFAITDTPPPPPPPPPSYSATLSATPAAPIAGNPVTLTATVTQNGGAPAPTSYAWTCGNGQTATTTTNTYDGCAYSAAGTFAASVTVSNPGASLSQTATLPLTVNAPPAPVITLSCNKSTPTGCVASATVGGVQVDSARITRVDWSWGDSTHTTTATNTGTHLYAIGGVTYQVIGTVTVSGNPSTGTGQTDVNVP